MQFKYKKILENLSILFASSGAVPAQAVDLVANPYVGVMQQPASHYYHTIYGFNADLRLSPYFQLRLGGFERPRHESESYVDQDYGVYGMLGGALMAAKSHGLKAYMGYGRNQGYVSSENSEVKERRTYSLKGVQFSMEYYREFDQWEMNFSHIHFVGSDGSDNLKAFVAWPFIFFNLGFGYRWG